MDVARNILTTAALNHGHVIEWHTPANQDADLFRINGGPWVAISGLEQISAANGGLIDLLEAKYKEATAHLRPLEGASTGEDVPIP